MFNVVLFLLNLYAMERTENGSNCPLSSSWCTEPLAPFLHYRTLSYFSKWCMKILIITCNHYFRPLFSMLYAFYLTRNGKTQLFWTDYWKYMRPFGSILSWHYCIYEKTMWLEQVMAGDSVCLELHTYRACRKESLYWYRYRTQPMKAKRRESLRLL
jgi:hypothetical protein